LENHSIIGRSVLAVLAYSEVVVGLASAVLLSFSAIFPLFDSCFNLEREGLSCLLFFLGFSLMVNPNLQVFDASS
jgi:hypothetical protein